MIKRSLLAAALLVGSFLSPAHGKLLSKVGSFNFSTYTRTQSVAVDFEGEQPKVVIFLTARAPESFENTVAGNVVFGLGAATNTNQWALALWNWDGRTTTVTNRKFVMDACIYAFTETTGVENAQMGASFGGFTSSGFDIVVSTPDTNASRVVYMVLGGSTVEAVKVATFTVPAALGEFSTTGVGFRPDGILVAGDNFTSGAYLAQMIATIGFAVSAAQQGSIAVTGSDAVTTTNELRFQQSDAYNLAIFSAAFDHEVAYVGPHADGWTSNVVNAPAADVSFGYIAIKGPRMSIVAWNQQAGTGEQTISGAGFTPAAGMQLSVGAAPLTSTTTHSDAHVSLFQSASAQHTVNIQSRSGVTTSDTYRVMTSTAIFAKRNIGDPHAEAARCAFTAFTHDGMTVDWSLNDGNGRQMITMFVGDRPKKGAAIIVR